MSASKKIIPAILRTGLIAGTLDITGALIHYFLLTGNNPLRIFYFISSAIFGKAAYDGSLLFGILGLLFHYTIAIIFSAFFFFIYPRLNFLSRNIVVSGLAYGIFVWLVMNLIVLPLSHIGFRPFNPLQSTVGILIIMFAIGLPLAILTYRYYQKNNQQ